MAQPELVKDIEARVKIAGDTMTGNLIGKYFQGTWLQTSQVADLGKSPSRIAVIRDDGWLYYRTPSELANDIGLTGNYILKSGDTMTGQLVFNNNTSNQNSYPSIKWGTIQSNTPFIGYATDQKDGTFIITSLKGTTYATGLAIGGSSQNLLYKGQIVLNASNFNQYAPSLTGSGASGTWNININGNATSATKATQDGNGAVISSTYLPLAGGTMTGTIFHTGESAGRRIITGNVRNAGIKYDYSGRESLIISSGTYANAGISFYTANELNMNDSNGQWNTVSPSVHILKKSLAINYNLIADPSYNFYVNGTSYFNGASHFNGTSYFYDTAVFTDRSQINKIDFSPLQTGAPPVLALALKNAGYALYNDEEFASGNNNCNIYNNNGNGTVTIQRVSDSTAANTSGYILKITSVGNATPGFGGFYQSTYARANAIYFQLFRAKIPVGYSVVTASNSMGSNYKDYWITNTAGTGRWEWYGRLTICGYTGSFSSGGHVYIDGSPTPSSSAPLVWYVANCNTYDLTKGAYINATKVYGAIWNDYAEYRESDITQPGKCIIENGNDTLRLSTGRLQRGAEIVSDTFGFAIGETDICKTPIAASGRVLAYGYEDREQFKSHIGYPVCSGPNGTVSIMTDEEEQLYPSRIIGYVSAVPDYETWGTGNVKVDGRIWIRIK